MPTKVYTIIARPAPKGQRYIASCNGQTAEADRPAHAALDLAQRLYPTTDHTVRRITGVAYTLEVPVQEATP